jgi:hypothetical protein
MRANGAWCEWACMDLWSRERGKLELAVVTAAAAPSELQIEGGYGRSEEGDEGI